MVKRLLGILMFFKYSIWDFVFDRKLIWVERNVVVCVKLFISKFFFIIRYNSLFDVYVGSFYIEIMGFW